MNAIRRTLRQLLSDQNGATAIEYGLIAALIVIGMMVPSYGPAIIGWRDIQLVGQDSDQRRNQHALTSAMQPMRSGAPVAVDDQFHSLARRESRVRRQIV